jgi:hypothetical protein
LKVCLSLTRQDAEPPVIQVSVTPPRLRRGQRVDIVVQANEPLLASALSARLGDSELELKLDGENRYRAAYQVTDGDTEGVRLLSILAHDLAGNPATTNRSADVGRVVFDFTPPQLSSVTVVSPRVREGVVRARPGLSTPSETVRLRFVTDEAVRPFSVAIVSSNCGQTPSGVFRVTGEGAVYEAVDCDQRVQAGL